MLLHSAAGFARKTARSGESLPLWSNRRHEEYQFHSFNLDSVASAVLAPERFWGVLKTSGNPAEWLNVYQDIRGKVQEMGPSPPKESSAER